LQSLGASYRAAKRWDDALKLYEKLREHYTQTVGADDQRTLDASFYLGLMYQNAGKFPEAVAIYEDLPHGRLNRWDRKNLEL